MAVRRILGSVKSICCSYVSKNKIVSACIAGLMLFIVVEGVIISPNGKTHKIQANSFLSPWDMRSAPSPCAMRDSVVMKPAKNIVASKEKPVQKEQQTAKASKLLVVSSTR